MIKVMKKKNSRNYILYIALIIVGILSISYSLNQNRKINKIENSIKVVTNNIKSLFINDDLNSYENIVFSKNNNIYQEEINELKDLLNLKKIYPEYRIINSAVTTRNKSYFLNTLEIDKGEKNGIKENMAVVTPKGLIGKISKVYKNSSEVKLLSRSSKKYKTSIIIKAEENDYVGIIDEVKDNLIVVKSIDKNSNIKINDLVFTSGMEERIPKGIYIGKVEEIKSDKYNLSKILYIKTEINFNKIHYVSIIGDKSE